MPRLMMTNNIEKIIRSVKELLGSFLAPSDVEEFIRAINTYKKSLQSPALDELVDIDKNQIAHKFTDGLDERIIVDKIITLAERLLSKEHYFKLLLEFALLMIKIGNLAFALEILTDMKNKVSTSEDKIYNAEANLIISKIYWSQAQWEDCEYYITEAYLEFKNLSNYKGYAKCENMLGTLFGEKGDFQKALIHFEAALAFLKESDDISTQAMILTNLGIIYTIYGDYEKAIWNYKDAIEKFKTVNDPNRIARVYHNIGMLYSRMGEYYLALEQFNNSITISLEYSYLSNCAVSYIGKAYIYTKLNNIALADAFTDKAMEIACTLNDTLSIADIYRVKGIIQSNLNNFELSEEFFENSIRLNDDFESKYNKAESSEELGKLLDKSDRKDEAELHLKSAEEIFKIVKKKK